MQAGVNVSFFGVRGSTPCHCASMLRYGGNTSCVVVEADGSEPIILDAGTGLRYYGLASGNQPFLGTVLLTHLHWDHIQGLPFFPQFLQPQSQTTIYGPPELDQTFFQALRGFISPPYFPICIDELPGNVVIKDLWDTTTSEGSATITARSVPHTGRTNGYRLDINGASVAYIPDHQQPEDPMFVDEGVLELVDGVDLLIHDAQYTDDLFSQRSDWGHCTPAYAVRVAEAAGAKKLAMFHHDPLHDDEAIDRILEETQALSSTVEIVSAAEGVKLSL